MKNSLKKKKNLKKFLECTIGCPLSSNINPFYFSLSIVNICNK